jgi:hypothetical protein
MTEQWTYGVEFAEPVDLTGFDVEAADGHIGKIDEATYETGAGYVVVDTGFWIFGKRRMIPAGAITEIDLDNKMARCAMTKDQIKDAPDFDEALRDDTTYRKQVGDYYSSL